jgi:hypothetical protein
MARSVLGRAITCVAILATATCLSTLSGLSETVQCRTSPGAPAPTGMHWYYRVDRTTNRHCWYINPPGMRIHARENKPISNQTTQLALETGPPAAETERPSPQNVLFANAEILFREAPHREYATAAFNTRWLDLPESVDLTAPRFLRRSKNYDDAHKAAVINEQAVSTQVVSTDTGALPRKSIGTASPGSIFLGGALSLLVFGGVLKWIHAWPSLEASDLDQESDLGLSELILALRRADEALKSRTPCSSYGLRATELLNGRKIRDPITVPSRRCG